MGQVTISTPDGKTITVPYTGTPPSDADIHGIINDYEAKNPAKSNPAPADGSPSTLAPPTQPSVVSASAVSPDPALLASDKGPR